MIPFNRPPLLGTEVEYVLEAINNRKISGDGPFTQRCHAWFKSHLKCEQAFLAPSCTHALEMMAILLNIEAGDEVIMPSFTFPSTANAFVLRGAKIIFVDIRPDTMNVDENRIEAAITNKTKAIMVVHYAGVACEMDTIMSIANRHNIPVIEDAAQGMMSHYKGRPLGTIGCLGAFSFHETKNYSCGEGGLLIINDSKYSERAEIIREKGTNRSKFFRGMIDKYGWVDIGSSYLCSDINAAYLYAQLERAEEINHDRLASWHYYYHGLVELEQRGHITLPELPDSCTHNGHIFFIKTNNLSDRTKLIKYLEDLDVKAVFHYVPLHASDAGKIHGSFHGKDIYTTQESEKLLRLPMFYGLSSHDASSVINSIKAFYQ